MTIEVEIAGTGQIAEFPDGTPPEVMQQALAGVQPEQNALGTAIGAADIIGAGVVGAGKEVIEGLSGLGGVIMGKPVSESVEAAQALTAEIPDVQLGEQGQALVQRLTERFRESPEIVQEIVNAAATLGPSVGEAGFQAARQIPVIGETIAPAVGALAGAVPGAIEGITGLRAPRAVASAVQAAAKPVEAAVETATDLFTTQSPTKQRIAELIKSGSTDIETARFRLEELTPQQQTSAQLQAGQGDLPVKTPRIIKDKPAVEAIKQGFDEGVVAAVKGSSPADRAKMRQMVDLMERGKRNARFALENRPSDVVGDSLLERFRIIKQANKQSGLDLNKVARSLKGKPVDISAAVDDFSNTLEELGVRLIRDSKGNVKPDFELSQLGPGDRGPLREVIRQMNLKGRGGVDGLSAHQMKKIIDNNVTFGKVKTGISGDAERALKGFRSGLDNALDTAFPEYDKVNTTFAETINAIDSLQGVAGRKMDLTGASGDKAVGTLLRRLMSNSQSRINLLDSITEIESTAKKHGGKFKDDILSQVLFADELDSVFGPVARTSFQGQIQQGVEQAGQAVVSPVAAGVRAVGAAAEKVRGINEEGAFKAIKQLLGEQ